MLWVAACRRPCRETSGASSLLFLRHAVQRIAGLQAEPDTLQVRVRDHADENPGVSIDAPRGLRQPSPARQFAKSRTVRAKRSLHEWPSELAMDAVLCCGQRQHLLRSPSRRRQIQAQPTLRPPLLRLQASAGKRCGQLSLCPHNTTGRSPLSVRATVVGSSRITSA